jgi:hypothetical protein
LPVKAQNPTSIGKGNAAVVTDGFEDGFEEGFERTRKSVGKAKAVQP